MGALEIKVGRARPFALPFAPLSAGLSAILCTKMLAFVGWWACEAQGTPLAPIALRGEGLPLITHRAQDRGFVEGLGRGTPPKGDSQQLMSGGGQL